MAPTLGAHPGDTLRVSTGFASKGGVTGWAAQTGTPTFRGSHYGTGHALMAGRGLYRNEKVFASCAPRMAQIRCWAQYGKLLINYL